MTDPYAPGTEIDGYLLGERLHAGAMGLILRVTHPAHSLPLVMKIPHFGSGDSAENLLGFEMESMILPVLSGPHLPRFIASGDITRLPYLVLEFIAGESLEKRLARGRLPAEELAKLGAGIADALHNVHRQGAIHLDLKPDNVLLREQGGIALIDFGLAHHTRFPDLLAEEHRDAAGSAPYVSPEQVDGCRSDLRSDLFSLGVVLYEMATGELPFGLPATNAGLRDRLWLDPPPPRAYVPDLPPWLQEIILRCLEVDAAARYQTAAHIAFDLRHPSQVPLTARAAKQGRAGFLAQAGRWWRARERRGVNIRRESAAKTPVVLVAIDTAHPDDSRQDAIQRATRDVLAVSEEYRLICVSVLRGFESAPEPGPDGRPSDLHLEHLVRLRHWAEPLQLPAERLSLHVLEALSPSSAILEFARRNHVDLIVLGAPGESQRAMAWWRSAASTIAANAPCSVYLVRPPEDRAASAEAGDGAEGDIALTDEDMP